MSKSIQKLDSTIGKFIKSHQGKKRLVLIRKGESMANLSGLVNGQTDPILTITGRKQANFLYPGLYKNFEDFESCNSSDLIRCRTFTDISTGFYGEEFFNLDTRLREIDFGDVRKKKQFDRFNSSILNLIPI